MQLICFLTNLAIIVITYLSTIQTIVEILLYSSEYIFPGWYHRPSVRVPSSRCQRRQKPKFDPHDHLLSLRHQKRYKRQWKQVKDHHVHFKNFMHHRTNVIPKDVPPFQTLWIIHIICLVVVMERPTRKWISKSIGRSMTWMTTLMDTLALRFHRQQSKRTYQVFMNTYDAVSNLPTSV